MADERAYEEAEDVGSGSPASEEAKEQSAAGHGGGRQEARPEGTPKQPAQTSGRRPAEHQQKPEGRKSFAPGQAPSEQGEGEPGPERIAARQSQQGIGAKSGSHAAHGERTEEQAQKGEPGAGHTRRGRQRVPGQPERPTDEYEKDDTVPG